VEKAWKIRQVPCKPLKACLVRYGVSDQPETFKDEKKADYRPRLFALVIFRCGLPSERQLALLDGTAAMIMAI